MIAKQMTVGNTKITIHDDYVVKADEVKAILKRCAEIVKRYENVESNENQ